MAIEERQTQIREGAGLEESRINTEFVELLRKYSTPILLVVAIAAGGFFLYKKRNESRARAIDESFEQLDAASASRSLSSLKAVTESATGAASAGLLAQLMSADLHLDAFRTGVPAGIAVGQDGKLPEGVTLLTDEQRQTELKNAADLYQAVASQTENDTGKLPLAVTAMAGLAAVQESKGEFDAAKATYAKVATKARAAGMEGLAKLMEDWAKDVDQLKVAPRLYEAGELASATAPSVPVTTPLSDVIMKDAQGNIINMTPSAPPPGFQGGTPATPTTPAPAPAPEPAPTPAPAPAPAPAQPDAPKP